MVGAVAGLPAGALEEVTLTVRLNSAADFLGVCLDGAHLSGGTEWRPNVKVPSSYLGTVCSIYFLVYCHRIIFFFFSFVLK